MKINKCIKNVHIQKKWINYKFYDFGKKYYQYQCKSMSIFYIYISLICYYYYINIFSSNSFNDKL